MTIEADWTGRWRLPVLVGSLVLILDQLTKWWAVGALDDGRTIDLFWTLRLRLVENTGAAFSRGEGLGPLIGLLVIGVVVLLVRLGARTADPAVRLVVGAVVGGALGNLVDRAFRSEDGLMGGAVIDFVDLQWWPVFNLADSVVVVGAVLILWLGNLRATGPT
ncbi:MAG TPA: signal peptidase II [Acidimicrobiales bacterium]|nr:signal peptidase II [Acidimicrobiales bacterium]MDP6214234.1 signal peptidase II [Acidimicrobiales bacterium]HJL89449.1 signal peptidase II [Acidimicrobiales bacterium]HJO98566.1 signal peptidase II [Acidimicrobiales bacterium]